MGGRVEDATLTNQLLTFRYWELRGPIPKGWKVCGPPRCVNRGAWWQALVPV